MKKIIYNNVASMDANLARDTLILLRRCVETDLVVAKDFVATFNFEYTVRFLASSFELCLFRRTHRVALSSTRWWS